jgi:hypothetical protein
MYLASYRFRRRQPEQLPLPAELRWRITGPPVDVSDANTTPPAP